MQKSIHKILIIGSALSSLVGIMLITTSYLQESDSAAHLVISNELSYFTIQSNIIVFFCAVYLLKKGKLPKLIELGSLMNITVTGIVYAFVLAGVWQPEGLAFVADALLHYVTPILYVLVWLSSREKNEWPLKNVMLWLAYPLLYLSYSMIRGVVVNFYPYPFIDASLLTRIELWINVVTMTIFFLIVGLILRFINNKVRF